MVRIYCNPARRMVKDVPSNYVGLGWTLQHDPLTRGSVLDAGAARGYCVPPKIFLQ